MGEDEELVVQAVKLAARWKELKPAEQYAIQDEDEGKLAAEVRRAMRATADARLKAAPVAVSRSSLPVPWAEGWEGRSSTAGQWTKDTVSRLVNVDHLEAITAQAAATHGLRVDRRPDRASHTTSALAAATAKFVNRRVLGAYWVAAQRWRRDEVAEPGSLALREAAAASSSEWNGLDAAAERRRNSGSHALLLLADAARERGSGHATPALRAACLHAAGEWAAARSARLAAASRAEAVHHAAPATPGPVDGSPPGKKRKVVSFGAGAEAVPAPEGYPGFGVPRLALQEELPCAAADVEQFAGLQRKVVAWRKDLISDLVSCACTTADADVFLAVADTAGAAEDVINALPEAAELAGSKRHPIWTFVYPAYADALANEVDLREEEQRRARAEAHCLAVAREERRKLEEERRKTTAAALGVRRGLLCRRVRVVRRSDCALAELFGT
ncbi:hypothetical protein DIPPA_34360 [Diplonema papillatum]|nr:hypothetical protein DIPPA_34360 [Diplonema papillatum]